MLKNSFRIGRLLGIDIRLDYSWFIVFTLVTWSLSAQYFPASHQWRPAEYWLAGILTSFLFFASVVGHELGHSVVAMRKGIPVRSITLFIFGGIAQISKEPEHALDEFLIAIAGPLVSATLGGLFLLISRLSGATSEPVAAVTSWLGTINLSLALFNLLPGFPLDGGRIFRSIVWGITGSFRRATRLASRSGQAIAYGFILLGIAFFFAGNWINGLWLAFIGWFLENASRNYYRQVALEEHLSGITARSAMITDWALLSPGTTLQVLISDYILKGLHPCFPVSENGRVVGIITMNDVKHVPHAEWATRTVGHVMKPLDQVPKVTPETSLFKVLALMSEQDIGQVMVAEGSQPLGMISRDRLIRYISTTEELAA